MDQARFQEAKAAYDAGDYRTAAKGFLSAAGRGVEGNGEAYHLAGNSLMKLRRYQDAVTVYGHALRDDLYRRRGAIQSNLGAAYAALGEYNEAVAAYSRAVDEPDCDTPYKPQQGMAAILMERGRFEEAGAAYRKAAIDPSNPDPGKALVNLGLCFMALGRPADAAEAYKAALGFDSYKNRGKALSNLGMAYAAIGSHEEAVKAFEKATQLHSHRLSAPAAAAYQASVEALRPRHETVEGWETGEIPELEVPVSPEGWETGELQALTAATPVAAAAATGPVSSAHGDPSAAAMVPASEPDFGHAAAAADALGFGDEAAVADFFAVSEEEMRRRDREARKAERFERRESGGWVRTVVAALVVVLVLVMALGAAWYFGLGWPTQESTTQGMLVGYQNGEKVDRYWVAVPDDDVVKEMAKIPPIESFTVDAVERGSQQSTVTVTVTPRQGAPLHYEVTLSREGVGWKVSGVENDWSSTGGGQ